MPHESRVPSVVPGKKPRRREERAILKAEGTGTEAAATRGAREAHLVLCSASGLKPSPASTVTASLPRSQ